MKKHETVVITHDSNKDLKYDVSFVKGCEPLITQEMEELESTFSELGLDKNRSLKYRWFRLELHRIQRDQAV